MNSIKNWIGERQTLKNEIVADELYAYLKDRVEDVNYEGRIAKEVILALVGAYGYVVLRDQGMLEICKDCDQVGVFRLVERKDEELKPASTDELVEQGFDINKVDFEDLSRE